MLTKYAKNTKNKINHGNEFTLNDENPNRHSQ